MRLRLAVTALLTAAGMLIVAPQVTSASTNPEMTLSGDCQNVQLLSQQTIEGGDVSTTWDCSGQEVQAAGSLGSALVLSGHDSTSPSLSMTPPASASNPSAASYTSSGKSVYWEALAVGVAPAQAATMTTALGDPLPAAAGGASLKLQPGGTMVPAVSPNGEIFNSGCATVYGDSDNAAGTACIQQSYLQNEPGQVYVDNQITSTGRDTHNNLIGLKDYYFYRNGHTYTRVGWSPSSTHSTGSPESITLTASFGPFSASVQEYLYPSTLNPEFPYGMQDAAFGSLWTGSNHDYNSANNVAIVHNGPGSPSDASLLVWIDW